MRLDQALIDQNLLGRALGDAAPWAQWLTVLKAFQGVALTPSETDFFLSVSGGRMPPATPMSELWCVVGRRSGKSRMAAAVAVWAALQEHRLVPGEVGSVMVMSPTKDQAQAVFGYCLGFLESAPLLAAEVVSATAGEIRLRGNIVISIHAANHRSIRGRTVLAAVFDETAFWRDAESTSPDIEVYRAVLPALASSGSPLVSISTPYAKSGLLHDKFQRFFGRSDEDTLVIRGRSLDFNTTTLDPKVIAKAFKNDPEAASAEWDGEFRSDVSSFFDDAVIEDAIDYKRPLELPPRGHAYFAFVDPTGGGSDYYSCCVAHKEDDRFICDVIMGETRSSPRM
jgi:hypothetical protein